MVVFQVIAPARIGGLERVVQALTAGQCARGNDVHVVSVVSPADSDTPVHALLEGTGAVLHVVELPARAYFRERRAVRELCRQLRPDVFHTHGYRPDVVDGGVARGLGIPTVTTMHGFFHGGSWKDRLTERLQLAAFRRFDAVVAVSRALRNDLCARGIPSELVTAIPNAWYGAAPFLARGDARRSLGISDSEVVVGWVGRVTRQKALDVAIAAVGQLQDIPLTLALVGDGEERSGLEEYVVTAGLAERVRWYGARENAHTLMRAFDVFVLCSRWEGTPIALLEAMAAGVPVVATAVGGVPDVVSSREGALVPAEDATALASAIRDVLSGPEAAAQRADAARERLQSEFAVDSWLDRYDALYESLLSGGRR
jgi:glycosyltransferase involved in cell wall biosynthesis